VATTEGAAAAAAPGRRRPGRPKGSGRKAAPAQAAPAAVGSANREAVRQVLLGFATEIVSVADQPKNLVKVLANVDRYVDRVVKSRG
jgi:hypothetical protein